MEVEVRPDSCLTLNPAEQGPRALLGTPSTVSVFKSDTEAPVLGQQQWDAVHARRARGHHPARRARELEPAEGPVSHVGAQRT